MLKTIVGLVYFAFFMLGTLPRLIRVNKLLRQKKIAEADRLSFELGEKWAQTLFRFTGSRVKVEGLEHVPQDGAVLFVSNHQALFDILLILGYIPKPKGFIAKKEIEKIPLVSTWMLHIKCIFMDRKNIRQSLMSINQGIDYLKRGYSLVIFPEGTRSMDGKLQDFKPGALKLAVKSEVPIVPVTINGTGKILGKDWRVHASDVDMKISPPIFYEEYGQLDINELTARVKAAIASKL